MTLNLFEKCHKNVIVNWNNFIGITVGDGENVYIWDNRNQILFQLEEKNNDNQIQEKMWNCFLIGTFCDNKNRISIKCYIIFDFELTVKWSQIFVFS